MKTDFMYLLSKSEVINSVRLKAHSANLPKPLKK
jgi:hypothetical protein